MQPKLQGVIVLVAGLLCVLAGGIGSAALASGAAKGEPFPYYLLGYGLCVTLIGLIGWKELRSGFNAVPWATGFTFLSLVAIGVVSRFA